MNSLPNRSHLYYLYYFSQYALTHENRGHFFIINNEKFKNGWARREGTDHDATKLEETFGQFGFETKTFKDLDAKAICNTIEERKWFCRPV